MFSSVHLYICFKYIQDFPGGSVVKNLPANAGDRGFISEEGLLEKEMATYSSILAWEIPWQRSLVVYNPRGGKRVVHDLVTKHTHNT